MELHEILEGRMSLFEAAVPVISPQEAKDRNLFGPVYHGTSGDINTILKTSFDPVASIPSHVGLYNRPVGTAHGYPLDQYAWGISAPVHHLGFGTYFTTVKAIAKSYNGDTTKNLKMFYLDVPNMIEINFGAPNTMMKWWVANGYDMTAEATKNGDHRQWIKSTMNLTRNLIKYDAVHFLGKGIRKLLDGDQICVYDPHRIFVIDAKLASGMEIGAKVFHTGIVNQYRGNNELYIDDLNQNDFSSAGKLAAKGGWKGVFRAVDHDGNDVPRRGTERNGQIIGNYPIHMIPPPNVPGIITSVQDNAYHKTKLYTVKWANGGEMHNYRPEELRPASEKK
jgi:hypothetical protein